MDSSAGLHSDSLARMEGMTSSAMAPALSSQWGPTLLKAQEENGLQARWRWSSPLARARAHEVDLAIRSLGSRGK